jgi:hypothetical protein
MIEPGLGVAGLYVCIAGRCGSAPRFFGVQLGRQFLCLFLFSLWRIAMSANYAADAEIATLKAKGLEGRHRNFQRLVRIWESPRAGNFCHRKRQELFGSLDPALTNLIHAASSVR